MQMMVHGDLFTNPRFPLHWFGELHDEELEPQRLNLIIKGNEFLATAHAAIRGIPIQVTRVLYDPQPHTSATCSESFEAEIIKWYHEDAGCSAWDRPYGYAIGSLLYYGKYTGARRGEKLP